MKNKINLVLDSNALCYKSLYSMPTNLSSAEARTNILFGFLHQVFKFAKQYKSSNIIFCWDSRKSYRQSIYSNYKRKRSEKRKELSSEEKKNLSSAFDQFTLLRKEVLFDLGFSNVFFKSGYESDDLIAYIVKNSGEEHLIFSSDNDLYQLLSDNIRIHNLKSNEIIDRNFFLKKYRIESNRWLDVKCLTGCSTDEVEGISGVGEKKAIDYLNGKLIKGKVFDKIKASNNIIERNYKLIRLPYDENFKLEIKENNFSKYNFIRVFNQFAFRSFLEQPYFDKLMEVFIE